MLSGEDYFDDIRKEIVKRYSKDGIKVISERFVRKGLKNPFQKNDLVFKYASQNWKNTDLATSSEVIQGKKRYVRYQEKSDFKYM